MQQFNISTVIIITVSRLACWHLAFTSQNRHVFVLRSMFAPLIDVYKYSRPFLSDGTRQPHRSSHPTLSLSTPQARPHPVHVWNVECRHCSNNHSGKTSRSHGLFFWGSECQLRPTSHLASISRLYPWLCDVSSVRPLSHRGNTVIHTENRVCLPQTLIPNHILQIIVTPCCSGTNIKSCFFPVFCPLSALTSWISEDRTGHSYCTLSISIFATLNFQTVTLNYNTNFVNKKNAGLIFGHKSTK